MIKIQPEKFLEFARTNNPKMAEKDYLECAILEKLFQNEYINKNFVFAGGASVTKSYNISNRIGQDIDLACSDFTDIPDMHSKKKLNTFRKNFKNYVFDVLKPAINNIINQDSRFMIVTDRDWNALENKEHFLSSPTLHLLYRSHFGTDMGHLCIEIIPRKYPDSIISVRSVVPYSTLVPMGTVPTVAYQQTFWDKVYALHSNANARIPHFDDGFSRHYYDVATLAPFVDLSETYPLFHNIEAYQAKYTTKEITPVKSPSEIVLLPDDSTLYRLADDYHTASEAFNAPRETWADIVRMLQTINQNINNIHGGK
ncbi:MAG: nucleotidyl transferase AbiEii/AbiGii toxin family protein [Alphaproteobacteria bacterium]|nr:nucleotidyl transferase AbiEii/AbiGii toxin family protein [Alphaproteobacteria bacterium]